MRINMSIKLDKAPAAGRFEFVNARCVNGGIMLGWGNFSNDDQRFSFTSVGEPCHLFFAIDADDKTSETKPPLIKMVENRLIGF